MSILRASTARLCFSPASRRTSTERWRGRLGDGLGLVGYALDADRAHSGEELYATLYWQALAQWPGL